ncbi:MAG: PAS domain S-box protein [Bryobacterales bacterium]|nr:PAS domain S-box protein [Bryobacterales bacterium]
MEMLGPRQWIPWLIRVRIFIISFLLGIQLILQQAGGIQGLIVIQVPLPYFLAVIVFWYVLALIFHILHKINVDDRVQANLQMVLDSVMVSLIVYITGGVDSFFYFLFPVTILMSSIVLTRMGTYRLAALCFVEAALILLLPFAQLIPSYSIEEPSLEFLQYKIATNLAAFLAVAFLAGKLTDTLHRTGAELRSRSGQLEDLRALNQDIVESMRGGLITTDLEGRILLLNSPGREILGIPAVSLAGKTVHEVFPGLPPVQRYAAEMGRLEILWKGTKGDKQYLGFSVAPLTRNGAVDGFVYNFQDVTQLKQLQSEIQLKDRMAAIGRMAAAIAHEIRNPLAAIAGSVKLFSRMAQLNQDEQKLIAIVLKESERLNGIITDFLLYSREKTYEINSVNVAEILEETLTLLQNHPQMDERFRIERLMPVRPVIAPLDADRMRQVFWNLGDNAIKAMPEGGVLTVELRTGNEQMEILFRDTGIGIRPGQAEKIFEPFQTEFTGGTGLGLAIAYQIIQAHGGTIRAESEGKGSTLHIELPLTTAENTRDARTLTTPLTTHG